MSQENEVSEPPQKGSFIEQYVGYYEWEGLPCRVRKDEENPYIVHAEMYIPGKGFVPASSVEVFFKGHALDEQHYKELLLGLTIKKRTAQ